MTNLLHPEELVNRYLAVWSEPSTPGRRKAVRDLWTDDGVEYVEGIQFRGHTELDERIDEAYRTFVATGRYTVASAGDTRAHGDIVTFTIQLRADDEVAWAARVFLVVDEHGRIREDYHLTVRPLPTE